MCMREGQRKSEEFSNALSRELSCMGIIVYVPSFIVFDPVFSTLPAKIDSLLLVFQLKQLFS